MIAGVEGRIGGIGRFTRGREPACGDSESGEEIEKGEVFLLFQEEPARRRNRHHSRR